jgi:hypothetical protein
LKGLASLPRYLLAKHGLLTPADDPEVAAVFMETEPECICEPGDPCDYHAALGLGSVCDDPRTRRPRMSLAEKIVRQGGNLSGSPSRFQYANKEKSE